MEEDVFDVVDATGEFKIVEDNQPSRSNLAAKGWVQMIPDFCQGEYFESFPRPSLY